MHAIPSAPQPALVHQYGGIGGPEQAPWDRATHELLARLFRVRLVVGPALLLVLVVFLVLDPVPWKILWIALTAFGVIALSVLEFWRIRHSSPGGRTIPLNLAAIFVLQTSVIFITGAIHSPMLVVYVPFSLLTGLSVPRRSHVMVLVGIPVVATLLLAAGAVLHWFPQTDPAFFNLGLGFWDRPVYAWCKALVMVLLLGTTATMGAVVRRSLALATADALDARREALDVLVSRNREILSVASTVAHELKNPLTSIQGLSQLMARTVSPGSKDAERLDVMRREISRMGTVLDEFRNFSRPLSGLALRSTNLTRLIEEIVLLNEGTASAKGVGVRFDADLDVRVECDPQKIKQALVNLMQNALDASPVGGTIDIRLRVTESLATVTLVDAGPGIAPEIEARLFTPGCTTKERGSGIGLVVARSAAEQHHGSLTVMNQAQGGCIATLSLPTILSQLTEGSP